MAYIVNWRDQQPEVAHLSAIRWPGLKHHTANPPNAPKECLRMQNLQGMVRHLLQGRKTSDHHKHNDVEQAYYIISGKGEVLVGEQRFPVVPGDAVYLPAGIHHQMFNDMHDKWLEHLVLGMKISDEGGGECVISNWSNVSPKIQENGAVTWRQLSHQNESTNGCFHAITAIDRETIQPGHKVQVTWSDQKERVYYVLQGKGILTADKGEQSFTDGDLLHITTQKNYTIQNTSDTWLTYVIVTA